MRMKQPFVSIIVPVYNLEEYLDRCVTSLCRQTCKDIEIILVDDGSTDESGRLCDAFAKKDERIRVIHKENGGLVSAWKCGLLESTCPYVCFVDGDDWIDDKMIEELFSFTEGREDEVVSCDYVIERPTGKSPVYQGLAPGEYTGEILKEQVLPRLLGNENRLVCLSRCMKLISRRLLVENAHYSDEKLKMGEDAAVLFPVLLHAKRLVILDKKAYYHYYYNPASMVHKYDKGLYENILMLRTCISRAVTDFEKSSFNEQKGMELKAAADREYLFLLMLVLKNEARGNPGGYYENIRKVCHDKELRRLLKQNPLKVTETANRLIYGVMKHPSRLMITLLRLSMIWYYRK